jgi:predicted DsbA family dithiol-disulfide isomerase
VEIKLVHFPLHPETPLDGITLEKLFAGRDVDMDGMHNRMKGLMDEEGLPYNRRSHTYNSRLAQELGIWADTQDGGDGIHDALFKAYFVDSQNIGDIEVLVKIAAAAGLDGDAARAVLENRSFQEQVDEDWNRSRQYGVTGVPTYVAGGQSVVGAQPYDVLSQLIETAKAEPQGG